MEVDEMAYPAEDECEGGREEKHAVAKIKGKGKHMDGKRAEKRLGKTSNVSGKVGQPPARVSRL